MQLWQTKMSFIKARILPQAEIICKQFTIHLIRLVQYMLEVTSSIIPDNNV